MTLNKAIEAYNRLAENQTPEALDDLKVIRAYLLDQCIRGSNTAAGLDYLNREADVVERLRTQGITS